MPGAKRSARSKTQPTIGVRERILHAAREILQESGLQRFTQVNVAERAGVRQSHLTYYFPTRRALLEAGIEHFVQAITQRVQDVAEASPSVDHETLVDRLATTITDPAHMRMFLAVIVEADGDAALRAMLVAAARQIEEALAKSLGGSDGAERARTVLAAIWGLGLYQFILRPSSRASITKAYLARIAELAGQ